jgi:cob(I)alamin adenosyltransferase
MSIYTRRGDDGQTDIIGKRVSKTDKRICAMGAISQACSYVEASLVFLEKDNLNISDDLQRIFKNLSDCCHDLALSDGYKDFKISVDDIIFLENRIDEFEKKLPHLNGFIRLGRCEGSAYLNIAMNTTRWAERETAAFFNENNQANKCVLKYLNRLSDYLFCAARYINNIKGMNERLND